MKRRHSGRKSNTLYFIHCQGVASTSYKSHIWPHAPFCSLSWWLTSYWRCSWWIRCLSQSWSTSNWRRLDTTTRTALVQADIDNVRLTQNYFLFDKGLRQIALCFLLLHVCNTVLMPYVNRKQVIGSNSDVDGSEHIAIYLLLCCHMFRTGCWWWHSD